MSPLTKLANNEKTKHSHGVYPNQLHLVPRIHLDLYHGQIFVVVFFVSFFKTGSHYVPLWLS